MTLREQVARALYDVTHGDDTAPVWAITPADWNIEADAAIRVVLAAVAEQIDEPLRSRLHHIELGDVHGYERALDDVLTVVARLGEA